jgi:hypothetical protein
MSIKAMSRIWAESRAEGSDLLVALAIADFANDDGEAFPSVGTLAKKARISQRSVQYSLEKLKNLGELDVEYASGPKGCNRYTLGEGAKSAPPKPASPGGEVGFTGGVQPIAPGGVNPSAPKPSLLTTKNTNTTQHVEELARLWNENRSVAMPQIRELSPTRKAHIRARLGAVPDLERQKAAIIRAAKSDFLNGSGDRGWVADFDWFLKPDTIFHIEEGKYDNRNGNARPTESRPPLRTGTIRSDYDLSYFDRPKPE